MCLSAVPPMDALKLCPFALSSSSSELSYLQNRSKCGESKVKGYFNIHVINKIMLEHGMIGCLEIYFNNHGMESQTWRAL